MEKLVKNLNKPEKVKKEPVTDKALEAVYQDLEEKLKQSLGTKVSIHLLHFIAQFQKTHGVGNCRSALGNSFRHFILLYKKR